MNQAKPHEQFVIFDWFVIRPLSALFLWQSISSFYNRQWLVGISMLGVILILGLVGQALYPEKSFNELASGKTDAPNFDNFFRSEFSHGDARKMVRYNFGVSFAAGFGLMVLFVHNGMKWYWGMLIWLATSWFGVLFIAVYLGLVMLIVVLYKKWRGQAPANKRSAYD